ncbi:hypothetical protein [Paenibacillus albidus]|nr:hypothetical protein [Paenibacillus albidus]
MCGYLTFTLPAAACDSGRPYVHAMDRYEANLFFQFITNLYV